MNPSEAVAEWAVEFRNVTKSFGSFVAVEDLSLTIPTGCLVTLLGPSGCGKTTTLRLIAGLETATLGAILVNGVDVTSRPPAARDISMVFQSYALFPHMTVLRNVGYGLVASGHGRREANEASRAALALVGLAELGERLPSELSGGQQQRVAVARAIVLEPAVLLLDEPLSNLDARLRTRVRDDIRELQQRLRLTAVYVTHDQEEAMAVSDRIIVMNRGRIAQDGTPRQLYLEPADRFVASFMGDATVVEGEIESVSPDGTAILWLAGLRLERPARGLGPGPAAVAIRPEAVRIRPAGGGDEPVLAGTVVRGTFLGDRLDYAVDTPLGRLAVRSQGEADEIPPGTDVGITFGSRGIALLPP